MLAAACSPGKATDSEDGSTGATDGPTTDEPTTDEPTTDEPTTGAPMVDCSIAPGDHAAADCGGVGCPITVDVEIACPVMNFASPGIQVAAASEVTWLASASEEDRMLFRIGGDGSAERIPLPGRFARQKIFLATGPTGMLHVAAAVPVDAKGIDQGVAYLSEAGGWQEQLVDGQGSSGSPVAGFQVDDDDTPRVWFFGDGPDDYREAVPDGQGAWTQSGVEGTPGGYGTQRFGRDGGGRLLAVDMSEEGVDWRLGVAVDGALRLLGSGGNSDLGQHYVFAPRAWPSGPPGPPYAGLIESAAGVQVVWPLAGDVDGVAVVPVPATLEEPCRLAKEPVAQDMCPGPCVDNGSGYEAATTSFARSPDGLGWVVFVTTKLDVTYGYELKCEEEFGCNCVAKVESDASTSVLHVFRVTLDGSPPVEVLTLPTARLDLVNAWPGYGDTLIGTHAHAFGGTLAIALRLRGEGGTIVRVLRVALADLSP